MNFGYHRSAIHNLCSLPETHTLRSSRFKASCLQPPPARMSSLVSSVLGGVLGACLVQLAARAVKGRERSDESLAAYSIARNKNRIVDVWKRVAHVL